MSQHLPTYNPPTADSILSCIVDGHAPGYICSIACRSCKAAALALSIRSCSCSAASIWKAYSRECTAAKLSSAAVRFCLLFLRSRFGIYEWNSGKRHELWKVFARSDLGLRAIYCQSFTSGVWIGMWSLIVISCLLNLISQLIHKWIYRKIRLVIAITLSVKWRGKDKIWSVKSLRRCS